MLVVLISCVSKKKNMPTMAKDMYISPLFKGAYQYSKKLGADQVFILSAKYGLLEESAWIEPYNESLNTKSDKEIKKWANEVIKRLSKFADIENDQFVFLAGEKYRKHLVNNIHHYSIPLKGLAIGKQLKFYKENL